MKTRVTLKYFVSLCLWKPWFDSNLVILKPIALCFDGKLNKLSGKRQQSLPYLVAAGGNFVLKEFQVCIRPCFRKINRILT